ncbi:MAG: VanZ family protein [Lachnospiraceae bacterium]|jgi:glycopeptide antibiotics resistance protein|nr:VanZ family protein [Lachnospiraceae bacterium]MDE7001315.1 VanZ family protein [Lachnospiraceae bacterium]
MKRGHKGTATVLFLIYAAVVLRITVFRSSFTLQDLCQNGKIILTLFEGYIDLIRRGDWFAFTYLSVGNIVWFVPFGMYLQYMGISRRLFQTALYGFLFSLLIESMQFVFGTGFSELDDLVLNTFGAWIGGAVVKAFRR